ncbi:hypothetical protein DTO96_100184 [Ephemeroptericola cinctiostellae]|uniref:Uncharacterized protein n=2 Tax=Ephemeroptericola cinctiostellae TaxID=2268024 RepID=A0A345D7Y8_9BURK|nr:hypothetical protein DTO96_100184 [Ephemeroptericola cinctiostellae]
MSSVETIAIFTTLAAPLSALYAFWSAKEARKANDVGRLNALLAFRQHYIELIEQQIKLAEVLQTSPSGLEAVQNEHANLDSKLREINQQINSYHYKVVTNKF